MCISQLIVLSYTQHMSCYVPVHNCNKELGRVPSIDTLHEWMTNNIIITLKSLPYLPNVLNYVPVVNIDSLDCT